MIFPDFKIRKNLKTFAENEIQTRGKSEKN